MIQINKLEKIKTEAKMKIKMNMKMKMKTDGHNKVLVKI